MTFGSLFASIPSRATAAAAAIAAAAILTGCGTSGMTNAMAPVAQPSAQTRLPAPGSTTYTSANTQDAAQQAGARAAQARRAGDTVALQSGPQDTGAFPNLNIRPTAANAQLSPEDSKALLANLRATQGRLNTSNVRASRSMPDTDSLRKLGAAHGDETLKAIQAESAAQ